MIVSRPRVAFWDKGGQRDLESVAALELRFRSSQAIAATSSNSPPPPGDYGRLQRAAGLMIAPGAVTEAAGKRQLIGAALVLAQHLHRQVRRRLSFAIELGQPFFARCHFQSCRGRRQSSSMRD